MLNICGLVDEIVIKLIGFHTNLQPRIRKVKRAKVSVGTCYDPHGSRTCYDLTVLQRGNRNL
jgi:hypothetical protein